MEDKEQPWYFTFGFNSPGRFAYVKIWGTYVSAREEMNRRYPDGWAFQYESPSQAGIDEYNLRELI